MREVVVKMVRHMVEILLRLLLGVVVAGRLKDKPAVGEAAGEDDLRAQLYLVAVGRVLRVAVALLQMRLECRFPVERHAAPSLLANPLRVVLVELLEVSLQVGLSGYGRRDLELPTERALE